MRNLSFLSKLLIGFLAFLMVAVAVIVYLNYYNFSSHFKRIVSSQLTSVAVLKADDLSDWRKERLSDAIYLQTNDEFHKLVNSYLTLSSNTAVRNRLVDFVKQLQISHHYDFFLVNEDGKVDFEEATNQHPLSTEVSAKAKECIAIGKVMFLDFYRNEHTQHTFLCLLIPLNTKGHGKSINETAVLRMYPNDYVYQVLATWPAPFQTADILLLRQEGDSMLFLNSTKNTNDAALRIRLPIVDSINVNRPAYFAGEGVWTMRGPSGEQYLAYSKRVGASPWILVSRIVKNEAYAPLRARTILLLFVVLLFFVAIIVAQFLVVHSQKSKAYQLKFEQERRLREREDLYSTLIRSVPQKIFFKNRDLVYVSCNGLVAEDLGISPEEIVGKTDYDLHDRELAEKFRADDARILSTGIAEQFEENYALNGEERTIFITKAPVKNESGDVIGILGVFTDISERKQSELQIKRLNRIYSVLSEVNQSIVRIRDLDKLYQRICEIGVTIGGYKSIWIGLLNGNNELVEVAKSNDSLQIASCLKSPNNQTCPVAKTLAEGVLHVCNSVKDMPCSAELYGQGILSSAFFPLKINQIVIGVVGFNVDRTDFFGEDEVKLLDELASDISFAIEIDAKERERMDAEASIKVQKERLEMAQRIGHIGSWELDPVTKTIWGSNESFRIYGLDVKENNTVSLDVIEQCITNKEHIHQSLMNLTQHGVTFDEEFEIMPSNGEPARWVHAIAQLEVDLEGKPTKAVGVIEDITEQHGYQVAMEKSEEYFRLLYEQAPVPYQSLNENGEIVEVNKAWLERLGYTREEVIGRSFAELLVPDQVPLFLERFPKFKQSGRVSGVDFILRYKNSERVVVFEVDGRIANDRDGRFKQTHCVLHDITEKREAELAIRESEARYKLLFESNPMSMCVYDSVTLRYMAVNEAMVLKYGYSREEFLTMTIKDIRPKEDLEELHKALSDKSRQRTHSRPWRHLLKDGTVIFVEITSNPIEFLGKHARLVLINDVSEKVKAERAVQESHLLAQSTLDSLSALICVLNENGEVLTINKSWLEFSKADHAILRSASIGKNFIDECLKAAGNGKESAYSFADGIKSVISGEARSFSLVYEVDSSRGTLWFLGKVFPFATSSSSVSRVVVISEDITRRKQYEISLRNSESRLIEQNEAYYALNEELVESNARIQAINEELLAAKDKAEESDRLKSAFLANMSHEIRTPMNGLLGFSEMLGLPNLTTEKRAFYLDIVKKTSQQLLSIINDIIDISKIETNQVKINVGSTNLTALMTKVKALLDPQATLKKLELRLNMAVPEEHCNIVTDEAKLTQVITNLINNALKFTPKGYIEFGVAEENGFLKFYVKDTGIGISPENQQLVFERFRQVETDLERHYGGSGLGLSISKAFVEVMGGRIWLESEVGIGTTFYFTTPHVSSESSQIGSQRAAVISSNNLAGIVILVAEDEDVNFLYLEELMANTGASIIRATNGKEAVEMGLSDSRISLVLMDIKMPVMNGEEATKRLKAARPHLPIIATTAYAMGGDRERLLKSGCDAYLSKPIAQKELLGLISNFLGR